MKEYIKKFDSLAAADGHVIDNPFTTTIVGGGNLVCNEEKKKLLVNDGQIEVISKYGVEPTMVDLGLSVKWADANLGATKQSTPESWYGDKYAWGETDPKENYTTSNYKFYKDGNDHKITKYCDNSSYWGGVGSVDCKYVLESIDDAPRVNFGEPYRMPTKEECEELIDTNNVTIEWCNNYNPSKTEHTPYDDGGIPGLKGVLITSKIEGYVGNCIFLPTQYFSPAYTWVSSIETSSLRKNEGITGPENHYCITFSSVQGSSSGPLESIRIGYHYRHGGTIGYYIRPVCTA